MAQKIPRRQAIPILYTRGTHYDVGFDMGRTFASLIKSFLELSGPLNECYIPLYNTEKGKKVFDETLASVKKSFPQYIRELEGVAEGAQVEFYKLFLLHMDDILPQSLKAQNSLKQATGCSTIILNGREKRVLAHTEDALTETLNHFYYVVAHIINENPEGKYKVSEERFMSLCYAGHLPGYTMNYNHHGLVFSINTLSAEVLRSGKTPRHFLTRALLSAENFSQAIKILKDTGVGAADGCSINLTFLRDPCKVCYNIEMAPVVGTATESRLDIKEIHTGDYNYHANKYNRIVTEETDNVFLKSSDPRMQTFGSYEPPRTKADVVYMLGDQTGGDCCVFHENQSITEVYKTLVVGVFDLVEQTFTIYSDNPREHEPQVTIPLVLKNIEKYERIEIDQANEVMLDSSISRMNTFATYDPPKTKADILYMLGDQSAGEHCVFRENNCVNEMVKTIAVGVFDLTAETLTIYSDNPRDHEAQVTLPLLIKNSEN